MRHPQQSVAFASLRDRLPPEDKCVPKPGDWQGALPPGPHRFLVLTAAQDALGGLSREEDYSPEGSARWREWGEGEGTHSRPPSQSDGKTQARAVFPRKAVPLLLNGKGRWEVRRRREECNVFFCFVGFGKLKRNPPPVTPGLIAKHSVISALSL